jgi:hypothetical protein
MGRTFKPNRQRLHLLTLGNGAGFRNRKWKDTGSGSYIDENNEL